MNRTNIEWVVNPDGTQGFTWNPITGCLHGCEYCYARDIAKRFTGHFKPEFHLERLEQPVKRKKPSTIFVGSMTDLFGKWVKGEWIEITLETVNKTPQHTYLFLTKNPFIPRHWDFPDNCFVGVTDDCKKSDTYPLDDFSEWITHTRKYISFEPLLGEIGTHIPVDVSWIIIGSLNKDLKPVAPEKGGTKKEWAEGILEQADKRKIPVFIKNSLYQLYPDLPKRRNLPYLNE